MTQAQKTDRWHAGISDPVPFQQAVLAWLKEAGVSGEYVASVQQQDEHTYLLDRFKLERGRPYIDRETKTAARMTERVTITTPPPERP